MARKRANLADLLNDLTFRTLYDKFRLISMNAFKWNNLPDGILERHVERNLFKFGKAIFYRKPDHGFMCLEAQNGGQLNVYGDPLFYHACGFGVRDLVPVQDCVIIENNMLRLSTKDFVMFYVNKLTEAERTMDVNVKANKTPIVVLCDTNDVMSFKTLFQKVDGNVPAIFADKSMNTDAIQGLDMKVKFLGNELMDYKHSVEAELLTFLGINNPAVDKKERLITDEANSNNQLIQSFFELQLEARERACEEINTMFGLDISVDPRQAVENLVEGVENDDSSPAEL